MRHSTVNNKVHELRTSKKLTQAQLAETCHVTRQTIIAIEKSKYQPTIELALRISKALNKKVEEVFWL